MKHVKNVETLEKLLRFCTGYGGRYNPVRPKLQLSTLNALLAQANEAMSGEKLARTKYDNVTNTREVAFKEVPKLASRIVNLLSSSGASAQALDDARLFFHKLYGYEPKDRDPIPSPRKGSPPLPEPPSPERKRAPGHKSYASIADSFEKLVTMVSTVPGYQAHETTLKVDALESKVVELKKLNTDAVEARVNWSNGLTTRNQVLYTNDTAIYNTGREVKLYVKAAFGPDSEEYAKIKKLNFTKPTA